MKKVKNIAAIALLICMLSTLPAALAECKLNAVAEGERLRITWSGAPAEGCTLTVSRDGWPVAILRADGATGETSVPLMASGTYTVRLTTANGCANTSAGQAASGTEARPVASTGKRNDALASEVIRQVNDERAKAGLSGLRVDAELTRAARVRAAEIVQKFSHTRPNGSAWNTVSASAYGENIAMGQKTADKVMAAWLTSAGHRANILRSSFGSIGVCAYVSGGVTYWVQLFGR